MSGLTAEALAERRKGIGGSDAAAIVAGGEAWWQLWMEKTGRAEGVDLSDNFQVQLGHATEKLNLDWYELKTGRAVTRRGEVIISAEHPMLRCTLDGFDAEAATVVQAKHVNGFSKSEELVARYTPQVTHEMIVAQVPNGILSVIIGTNDPQRLPIDYDAFFADEYIERAREFWSFVAADKEPPGAPALAVPQPKALRKVDMTGNNLWADLAFQWGECRGPAKQFKDAEAGLKKLIEADVAEAWGHGIIAKRDGRGLTIKAA